MLVSHDVIWFVVTKFQTFAMVATGEKWRLEQFRGISFFGYIASGKRDAVVGGHPPIMEVEVDDKNSI
jgi:hypothetical protein